MHIRKDALTAVIGAATAAAALGLGAGPAAHAATATPLFTATTSVTNAPDSGGNGTWAFDTYTRTFSVYPDPGGCTAMAGFGAADTCYSATVADLGTSETIPGAYQPNQGDPATGDKISGPSVTASMTGSAGYTFYAPGADLPSAANVHQTVADNYAAAAGENSTDGWFMQAFKAGDTSVIGSINATGWSWSYATGCETWTDAWNNGDGQSANLSADGNITGLVCPASVTVTPSPAPAASSSTGDYVNPYGNGLDVFQRDWRVNARIVGWTASAGDPATVFDRVANSHGGWSLVAVGADGVSTGLCVSDPAGGYPADPGGPSGLVLRVCNGSAFQGFTEVTASGHTALTSDISGGYLNPHGKGAQLTVDLAPVAWSGWQYTWTAGL